MPYTLILNFPVYSGLEEMNPRLKKIEIFQCTFLFLTFINQCVLNNYNMLTIFEMLEYRKMNSEKEKRSALALEEFEEQFTYRTIN